MKRATSQHPSRQHSNNLLRHARIQNLRNHQPGHGNNKCSNHPHHMLVLPERFNDRMGIRLHPPPDQFRQELETAA